jgi:integrase
MFRRRKSFYVRLRGDYGDRWVSLGSDYEQACRRLREIRSGAAPTARVRVKEGAQRWLETYVRTNRNAKNVLMAEHRVERYLLAYFREALTRMSEPYGFIVRFGLETGLRWGEMTRAQSTDIQNGVLVVHQTKTGKVRRVPLPPNLKAELRHRVGKLIPYSPLASGSFARMVNSLTGIQFHPHQLRHTFACRWLERGGSLAGLQSILGHSTIVTTQRYARLSDDHVRAEVERINGNSVAGPVAS